MMTSQTREVDSTTRKVLHRLDNAVVTPTIVNRADNTFSGCVYDQHGEIVAASTRTARNVIWAPANPERFQADGDIKTLGGTSIYLGHYTNHYGHFLLETLARFWVFELGIPYDRVVFQPFIHSTPKFTLIRRLVRGVRGLTPGDVCLKCFGIRPRDMLVVDRPLRFTQLLVPSALVEINNCANEEQARTYQRITDYCKSRVASRRFPERSADSGRPPRLFLSRSKLKPWGPARALTNEEQVEREFAAIGFRVIHPQCLPFTRQVFLYNRAEIIAGFAGSAMHNSVFMRKGTMAITIGSLREGDTNIRNQVLCDGLSGVRSVFISFKGKAIDERCNIAEFDVDHLRSSLSALGLR